MAKKAVKPKLPSTVLRMVLGAEIRLEIHRSERAVVQQFRRISGIFRRLLHAITRIGWNNATVNRDAWKVHELEAVTWLEETLNEFVQAAARNDAHRCCRLSRDLHCGLAILVLLQGVRRNQSLFNTITSNMTGAISNIASVSAESDIYSQNIRYRLASMNSLAVLDGGLNRENLMAFTDRNLNGLTSYLLGHPI